MVSKVRNVRLGVFSGGGCHHPNVVTQYASVMMDHYYQPNGQLIEALAKPEQTQQIRKLVPGAVL